MIACMLWKGTPYYAKLNYEDGGPSVSTERRKVMERVFACVSDKHANAGVTPSSIYHQGKNKGKISKKELIDELRDLKIIPVYPPSQSRSAPHSRLRAILDPLEKHW